MQSYSSYEEQTKLAKTAEILHNHLSPKVHARDFYRRNEEVNWFLNTSSIKNPTGIYLTMVKMMQATCFISATQIEATQPDQEMYLSGMLTEWTILLHAPQLQGN